MIIAATILIIAYLGIAFAHLPRINIDRPSAAFLGAVLMVIFGVLTFQEAIGAINFHTIALLLGMMVLVAALKAAGFFDLLATKSLAIASTPRRLLILIVTATAVASACFVNDAVVLLFTPIVLQDCRIRRVNPVPYLIAEAMASNIGSTATIIGNPQNMLIGTASGISFASFFLYLAPIALISAVVLILIIFHFYRKTFDQLFTADDRPPAAATYDATVIRRLIPVLVLTLVAFFLSSLLKWDIALIALAIAVLVLLLGREKPENVMKDIDWVLLLFFVGLFIVIEGARKAGVLDIFINRIVITPDWSGITSVSVVSVLVSQLVSNVPLTMLVLPVLENVTGRVLWIALAAGSTLGGNLTIIGAIANIIVVEKASHEGIHIGFTEFLKVGIAVTLATVALAILIMGVEYQVGWLR